MPILIPVSSERFRPPGLCEKVSANTLKHNGPANRDPSESMSDPVPQPPLFPVRARLAFLWGQPQFFSAFIGRLMRFGSASWLLDHLDSKRICFGLVIANLVGTLTLMLLVFLLSPGWQFFEPQNELKKMVAGEERLQQQAANVRRKLQ